MGNQRNKRVPKRVPKRARKQTDVEMEVADEEQFIEHITTRAVSDEMVEEAQELGEENQNEMEEEAQELGEEIQNEMEEEAQDLGEENQNEMEEEEEAVAGADGVQTQTDTASTSQRKRRRGPTKMKHIAKDPNERQHVDFTDMGDPCGPGSVLLSSYLGPLVREHVPVIIDNWRQVSEEIKTVLWKSIEMRFDLDEDFKKVAVFKQMGCLWRASKSRLVTSVRKAPTIKARMSLQPNNVTTAEWRKFVRDKTSKAFKVVSDSYKERRQKQIPHTCGRKGMVRLREDLVKSSEDPSKVSRLRVWVKSRTKKDGTPVNVNAAEKIKKASEIELEGHADSTTTNPKHDMLSQILGPDQPGRLRAMGRGISMTKLNCLQVKDSYIAAMEQKQVSLQEQVHDLQKALRRMNNQGPATDVSENQSVNNTRSLPKCYLVDWASVDEKVAEGRVVSAEADELVNGIPLGPHAVKVLVETAIKADTFLWRPAQNMFTLEDAVGEMIAWHSDHCIVATAGLIPEDNAPNSPFTGSVNKCKLMDYIKKEEVVAVGRWQTKEPKSLVNGLPLGPNAVKVYVDEVLNPTAYIWRPTVGKTTMEDFMNCYVAWPANCVVFESDMTDSPRRQQSDSKAVSSSSKNQKSPLTPPAPKKPFTPASPLRRSERNKFKPNQKIQLLDISGNNVVVAEGRWSSSNPEHLVHFQALGLGACRVFVDVVKVKDAAVWRTSSEIEYMEDALGSCLAWPEDKIITV